MATIFVLFGLVFSLYTGIIQHTNTIIFNFSKNDTNNGDSENELFVETCDSTSINKIIFYAKKQNIEKIKIYFPQQLKHTALSECPLLTKDKRVYWAYLNTLFNSLSEYKNLNSIELHGYNFLNFPVSVQHISHITSLTISAFSLHTLDITKFKNLEFLTLECYDIDWDFWVQQLEKLPNLKHLSTSYISKIPNNIQKLEKLKTLQMMCDSIDEIPESFFQLKNLSFFNLVQPLDICLNQPRKMLPIPTDSILTRMPNLVIMINSTFFTAKKE